MRELSVRDLRGSRLHLFWIQLVFTIIVVVLLVTELGLASETWGRASLGSSGYLIDGLKWAAPGLVVLVWCVPMGALALMAPVAWLLPLGEYQWVAGWHGLAIGCVVAASWVVLRSRNGKPQGPRQQPLMQGRFEESWAHERSTLGWLAVSGGLLLMVGFLIAHAALMASSVAFESRAERVVAEVVSYDDEIYQMVLRVDGEEFMVDEPELWEPPAVGETIVVLVDPDDPMTVTLPESLKDPAWLVGMAVVSPLAGLALGWPIIRRSYGRRRLVRHGAPASIARLKWADDSGFSLHAIDGRMPILEVRHIAGVVPEARVTAFVRQWFGRSSDPVEADSLVPSPPGARTRLGARCRRRHQERVEAIRLDRRGAHIRPDAARGEDEGRAVVGPRRGGWRTLRAAGPVESRQHRRPGEGLRPGVVGGDQGAAFRNRPQTSASGGANAWSVRTVDGTPGVAVIVGPCEDGLRQLGSNLLGMGVPQLSMASVAGALDGRGGGGPAGRRASLGGTG